MIVNLRPEGWDTLDNAATAQSRRSVDYGRFHIPLAAGVPEHPADFGKQLYVASCDKGDLM